MQGCAEIRWLAEKMGAKPATVAGLSGLGDIMLTCYGSLSRNRCMISPPLTSAESFAELHMIHLNICAVGHLQVAAFKVS